MANKNENTGEDNDNNTKMVGFSDPNLPVYFVNDCIVDITNDDISIVFSHNMNIDNGREAHARMRVVFSHAGYAEVVRFLSTRAAFIETLYGGSVPSLSQFKEEQLLAAAASVYGKTEEDTK